MNFRIRMLRSALFFGRSLPWFQYKDFSFFHKQSLASVGSHFPLTMRLYAFLLKDHLPKIEYYSRFSPSPLSIKQFLEFGKYERIHHVNTDSHWQRHLLLLMQHDYVDCIRIEFCFITPLCFSVCLNLLIVNVNKNLVHLGKETRRTLLFYVIEEIGSVYMTAWQ